MFIPSCQFGTVHLFDFLPCDLFSFCGVRKRFPLGSNFIWTAMLRKVLRCSRQPPARRKESEEAANPNKLSEKSSSVHNPTRALWPGFEWRRFGLERRAYKLHNPAVLAELTLNRCSKTPTGAQAWLSSPCAFVLLSRER